MNVQTFETQWGGRALIVEIGKLALQTNASCTVRYGDTLVMATAVMSNTTRDGIDYFPLMVDFDEKLYAAGIIKGSRFIKREGRPSDEAILTSRMIDRTIRPLFDDSSRFEVQIIVTPFSVDEDNDPDIIGIIAASIALSISDIPWQGPIAGIRVGKIASDDDSNKTEWVINPTYKAREKSMLDLVICGTQDKLVMIEGEAKETPEKTIIEAIEFGQKHLKEILKLIESITKAVGKKKIAVQISDELEEIYNEGKHANELADEFLSKRGVEILYEKPLKTKTERKDAFKILENELNAHLDEKQISSEIKKKIMTNIKMLTGKIVSNEIINNKRRVDGRLLTDTRKIESQIGLLPRTHGSGLFLRGETHVLSIVTLGSPGDEQLLEGIEGSSKKGYMHHYNFPPYSTGEVKPLRSAGRREIGHGALAERAIFPLLPNKEEFPYTIRVVSEVLGSNGSSSMASTCGSSLALMDAGVPIKKTVAGVAMGLATNDKEKWEVITDLQDLEDSYGGMDFKITGTRDGITAIQMDTKTQGLNKDIVKQTFKQALEARIQIIDEMEKTINKPKPDLSPYAPRIVTLHIDVEDIRIVIGPGGKTINDIIDKTGVAIDIEQDGTVFVSSENAENMQKAIKMIELLTKKITAGETYEGKVVRILDFGAFVEIAPGKDGLVHISELDWKRTDKVTDVVKIGDTVQVKVKDIDEQGRVNLSMKALKPKPEGMNNKNRENPRKAKPPFQKYK